MARGSGEYVRFEIDRQAGVYQGKMKMFGATLCHKYGP
jgi:hypothetical protein